MTIGQGQAIHLALRVRLSPDSTTAIQNAARVLAATPGFADDPDAAVTSYVSANLASLTPEQQTIAQLSVLDEAQQQLDSMDDISEVLQEKLQMAMDQRSKLIQTLSNVMKKIDDTQEAIVQNLKG